jgi:tetratricopeptide (TPR) repeat protein
MSRILPTLVPFAVLLIGSLEALAQSPPPTADSLFAHGVELHQSGDILGAIEAYKAALGKEPNRIDARSNLGAAYARLGRYADAVEQYKVVLDRDPAQTQVRFNLGLALYKSEETAAAAEELNRVVGEEPGNRNGVLLLADCWLQMGKDGDVVTLLGPRQADYEGNSLFSYLLGTALLHRNEIQRGQAVIDALFSHGETAEGHVLMAAACMRQLDHKKALEEMEKAVALNPRLPNVQAFYGIALMNVGRRPEAVEAFARELQSNPNDFDSNLFRGLILKDDGRLDEAYEHLKRAARLRPQDTRVLYGLGSLHLAAGRLDEAREALEAVTREVPDYRQAHVLLATVYYRLKKTDLAERERAIVEELKEKEQAQEPGVQPGLGPAYKGGSPDEGAPTVASPAPPPSPEGKRP